MKRTSMLFAAVLTAVALSLTGCFGHEEKVPDPGSQESSFSEEPVSESSHEQKESSTGESSSSQPESVPPEESSTSKEEESGTESEETASSAEMSSQEESTSSEASDPEEADSSQEESSEESSSSQSEEASEAVEPAARSCADIFAEITEKIELPRLQLFLKTDSEAVTAPLTEMLYTEFHPEDAADYAIGVPMMSTTAAEIAVFRPADEEAQKRILAAIDERVTVLEENWSRYLPDQYELVQNHQVIAEDGYIYFIIADKQN